MWHFIIIMRYFLDRRTLSLLCIQSSGYHMQLPSLSIGQGNWWKTPLALSHLGPGTACKFSLWTTPHDLEALILKLAYAPSNVLWKWCVWNMTLTLSLYVIDKHIHVRWSYLYDTSCRLFLYESTPTPPNSAMDWAWLRGAFLENLRKEVHTSCPCQAADWNRSHKCGRPSQC